MRSRRRLLSSAAALLSLVASLLVGAIYAAASPSPQLYTIGVDAAGPSGHNFEYVDYFPRGQVLPDDPQAVVGNGAILHFRYNLGSKDGLHTATLLPPSETPEDAWNLHPLVIPDEQEGTQSAAKPILNPDALFSRPAGCGATAGNPCHYTGNSEVNSGALPAFGPNGPDFFVRITVPLSTPTTIHYVCLVHPGMQGEVTVVPGGSSAASRAAFGSSVLSQWTADTNAALAVESAANSTAVTPNPDGSSTITMTAGTATQFVEVAEMLPWNVSVKPGDTVSWVTTTLKDPHTVTFPDTGIGPNNLDPLTPPYSAPPECEGSPNDGPPTCRTFEIPVNPVNNVLPGSPIASTDTEATSGIIGAGAPSNEFRFSFPNEGTFAYQCRIHEHMNGVINVA